MLNHVRRSPTRVCFVLALVGPEPMLMQNRPTYVLTLPCLVEASTQSRVLHPVLPTDLYLWESPMVPCDNHYRAASDDNG